MDVNASNLNLIYFQQGVRHIRKLQKTSKINLTLTNNNHSLSRVSSIDSKLSLDDKLPSATLKTNIVKKQTIFIYPTSDRNISTAGNARSLKLLPTKSRENSLNSNQVPKLPPALSTKKLSTDCSEFLTPHKQNSVKIATSIINETKVTAPTGRVSFRRDTGGLEKENANKSYLKRPKFILKQKEMFHYGDKLHDLIEKEKKEYIQKKSLGKNESYKEPNFNKNLEKGGKNISEYYLFL